MSSSKQSYFGLIHHLQNFGVELLVFNFSFQNLVGELGWSLLILNELVLILDDVLFYMNAVA